LDDFLTAEITIDLAVLFEAVVKFSRGFGSLLLFLGFPGFIF